MRDLAPRRIGDAEIEMELLAGRGFPLDALDGGASTRSQPAAIAEHVHLHALALQLGDLFRDVFLEQIHQRGDLGRGAIPVFLGKRKQGEDFDPGIDGAFHRFPHRLHAGPMAERPRQPAFARPAAVAVHDDRHMAGGGNRPGEHQTSMISATLAFTAASTALRCSSCVFWTSFSACFWSSEETCSVFLIRFIVSVRA